MVGGSRALVADENPKLKVCRSTAIRGFPSRRRSCDYLAAPLPLLPLAPAQAGRETASSASTSTSARWASRAATRCSTARSSPPPRQEPGDLPQAEQLPRGVTRTACSRRSLRMPAFPALVSSFFFALPHCPAPRLSPPQVCINTPGSYRCECKRGYTLVRLRAWGRRAGAEPPCRIDTHGQSRVPM